MPTNTANTLQKCTNATHLEDSQITDNGSIAATVTDDNGITLTSASGSIAILGASDEGINLIGNPGTTIHIDAPTVILFHDTEYVEINGAAHTVELKAATQVSIESPDVSLTHAGYHSLSALATDSNGKIIQPYKVYTAILNQSATSAPVATVLANTLSGTPVWGYTSSGIYTITLSGEWVAGKTFVINGPLTTASDLGTVMTYTRDSDTIITIKAIIAGDAPTNGLLVNTAFEVRVYP